MAGTKSQPESAAEAFFAKLRRVCASGGATGERSAYGPLMGLLNAIGATLKPCVFCVGELADRGAGHPDFGLYAAKQAQRGHRARNRATSRAAAASTVPAAPSMCAGRSRAAGRRRPHKMPSGK